MQRAMQFVFRVNSDERRAIADLAARLQRSQSDAVRFVAVTAPHFQKFTFSMIAILF